MQEYALKVENLTKQYKDFKLAGVSFELPKGYIMGFVGRNGAGKSTAMKCIIRSVLPDSGRVEVLGKDMAEHELELKQQIAYSSGAFESFPRVVADTLAKVYADFYTGFDFDRYEQLKKRFDLDGSKKLKEMSAGMRVKFSVALALSHDAKLFIFDEPTSGLDPVAREEMLELFAEIIEDGEKSVLFSTHITSDLDKCADYLALIDGGKICLAGVKDDIIAAHAVVSGREPSEEVKAAAIGIKKTSLSFTALVPRAKLPLAGVEVVAVPTIEDLLLFQAAL